MAQRDTTTSKIAMGKDNDNEDGGGTTGDEVDDYGEGKTGNDNDDNDNDVDGDGTERHNNQIEVTMAAGGNNAAFAGGAEMTTMTSAMTRRRWRAK